MHAYLEGSLGGREVSASAPASAPASSPVEGTETLVSPLSPPLQVMGMLQGKTIQDTFVVIDVFALPVEGTETRVNAQAEAYEYMVDFIDTNKVWRVARLAGCAFVGGRRGVVLFSREHPRTEVRPG